MKTKLEQISKNSGVVAVNAIKSNILLKRLIRSSLDIVLLCVVLCLCFSCGTSVDNSGDSVGDFEDGDLSVVDYQVPDGLEGESDSDTDCPMGCFLSEDSNYVLTLQRLSSDSPDSAYRAVIYDRERWYKGEWICEPLSVPAYIGYGTVCRSSSLLEFTFDNGYIDSDGIWLHLSCSVPCDSLIIAAEIPFSYREKDVNVRFKSCSWDSLKRWWRNPICGN